MSLLSDTPGQSPPPMLRAAAPAQGSADDSPSVYKWVVIEPALFPGEEIVAVMDPAYLDEARAENPGLVHYLLSEIELLGPIRDQRERLMDIHCVKKFIGGRVREIDGKTHGQFKQSMDNGHELEVQE